MKQTKFFKNGIILMMIAMMVMMLEVHIDMRDLSASHISPNTAYAKTSSGGRSSGGSFKSGGYSAPKSGSSKGSDFKSGSYSAPKQNPQGDQKANHNPNNQNGGTYGNPTPRQNNWFFGGWGFFPFGFGGWGYHPVSMFSTFFMIAVIILIIILISKRRR